ncbi:MAG: hypothetical protein J6332_00130 [Abditibacteriota bacterium]|nr:hypothetical protein [Abditibacteriota bacterium]
MKKLISVLALCALAGASFAATITDWYAYDASTFSPVQGADYISDYGSTGTEINVPMIADQQYSGSAWFGSNTVSGWTYDENGDFAVDIQGFESLFPPDELLDAPPTKMFVVMLGADGDQARHQTEWTGSGVYAFGPETLVSGYYEGGVVNVDAVQVYFAMETEWGLGVYLLGNGATGTIEFLLDEEEEDEPEVPEPAAFAYAAMGLASAFGLKRRIRK